MRLTALEPETSPGGRLPGIWGGGVALKCCAGLTRPPRSSQTRPTPAPERARPFWACTGPKPRRERLKWKQAGSRAPLVAGTGPARGGCSPCVREVARDASRGVAVGARLPRESWAGTFPRVDLDSGPLVPPLLEFQFSSVQSLSRVRLFATPRTTARQASLNVASSRSLLKLVSIESVMPSSHLTLCRPLLLPP